MKTDIIIHMFPARHMVRAVRLAVLSLLFWIGLVPASAQIYSTAQRGTQYKGTYEEAYGSMNNGYYGSTEAQYEYNPYQSNVYKPGSSMPNTSLRKRYTIPSYNPWSDSYAPMRTNKKNAPTGTTGGAIGEDEKSENDPEGETGAPDGFITPSDPGHQSNQSPVGEAWVLLFFAAAAALVVFIRQKREKRHIAIYSETQQPSDKSNMKQHIRKSLFISIILLAGVSNAWAENIPAGTIVYVDITNFSGTSYDESYYMSVTSSSNKNHSATKDNTSGAGSYVPKNDGQWQQLKQISGNLYAGKVTAASSTGRLSFWSKNESSYDNVWQANISLARDWSSTERKFTFGSGSTWHQDRQSSCFNSSTTTIPLFTTGTTLYLIPNNNWKTDNARFAACFLGYSGESWVNCAQVGSTGYYSVTVPDGEWPYVIFCRMKSGTSTNNWSNKWNQTNDLAPHDSDNAIEITGWDNSQQWCTIHTNLSVSHTPSEAADAPTISQALIKSGNYVSVTAKSAKTGYQFNGWTSTQGTFSSANSLNSNFTPNANNAVAIANYILKTYTVTFNANGHGTAPSKQTINHGGKATKPADLTATGYTFGGWYKEAGCTNAFDFNTAINADITLYAKWTAITYTVTFDQQSGTGGTSSVTATYGSAMPSITIPTRTGYTFGGYYTATNGGGTQYYNANGTSKTNWNIASNTTLYAKWTLTNYTITYHLNGGTNHANNPANYTIESAAIELQNPTRTGYTFAGWYDNSTFSGSPVTTIATGSTGNKTFYAKWTENAANTIYIRANEMWKSDGAKLAVYAWGDEDNTWIDFEYDDCTGDILMADIPAKYTGIQIARLNPNPTNDNTRLNNGYNFDNAWNQTSNLNIPTNNENNLYDLTQEYIYLKPNSNWIQANARFAAYFFGNGEKWVDMTDADGDGYYSCKKPSGYTKVIFCRMNPNGTDQSNNKLNWNNRWDQSKDQTIPNKNLFTVDEGQWGGNGNDNSGATGHWNENHWDNSQWTTYTAPTFDITINPCENGTIKVVYDGTTYTSGAEDVIIEDVLIHSELTITFTPAEGYELTTPLVTYADVVADNIYSICGPATISAEFVARGNTKVIYLRPNDAWLKDDAIFIAHAWKNGSSDQHDYLMTTKDDDYTGSYSCTIDSKYDHVLFARINPEHKTNQELNAEWMWNKTKNLLITNDVLEEHGYRFAIGDKVGGEGEDKDFYDGEWEENTPIWGITSDFNNWHAEDAVFMGYPGKINILLSAASHEFKLYNFRHGDYYGNTGTYRRTNSGQWWTMDLHNDAGNNCTVEADIDNEAYLFQLQLITDLGTYKKQISITYPDFSGGVYRLAYSDNTPNSFHPAHLIRCNTQKDLQLDTISFFVRHDKEPKILLQRCSSADVYTQNPTWDTIAIYPATSSFPSGDHPNNAQLPGRKQSDATIHIGEGCGITSSGVYNFILQQTNTGEHTAELDTRATHLYEGDYYIRTDYAEGGWTNYLEPANLMTYSSYADHNEPFSYYFCEWITSPRTKGGSDYSNIAYTIANPYSRCISDTLIGDDIIAKDGVTAGCLPDSANVRFTWDHETNALARAYLKGSGHKKDRFLVLTGKDNNLKDADGNTFTGQTAEGEDRYNLEDHEVVLDDAGNWIYKVDVKANTETAIKLTAKYNDQTQYFKGSKDEFDDLLESTDNNDYKIRIIYDFKTNQLITAWLPDDDFNVTEDKELGIDMMIIRTNQGQATQINFTSNKSLSNVGIGYAVMTFTEGHVTGSGTVHDRSLYWVSFPFDVWLRDVTGFGEYGQHWIMEYYDGESRAQNGLWADSDTYWKYITNPNYKLEAGKGYVLCLNLGKMATAFTNTDEVSLYFPSTSPLEVISSEVTEAVVPAHTCTIERDNRTIYDSNWNLIGVPGFKDITNVGVGGSAHETANPNVSAACVSFYYAYQSIDNSYIATAETNDFQIMHSYMVQFAGTIEWSSLANPPASVAARRTGDMPSEHTLRLELAQGEDKADQTIIKLQEQDATADFDMNIDMTKIKNSGANIYTLTENTAIMVAGNALPMEKTTIPVGIEVANAGTYTLRMPDGTDGISVTLIDNQTGIHTDMLLSEYTITLDAGSHLNRFYIAVDPDRTATSVENVGEEAKGDKAKGVEKYLIDGQLFIRTAEGIFDARGQRM